MTFQTRSERLPTLVAALVFLVPGVAGLVFGPLTWFGLTWVENASNGLLIGITCAIWTFVGVAVLRFRRWITIDPAAGVVERGTRTLFRHPAERYPLASFVGVEVRAERIGEQRFYVAALRWAPGRKPVRSNEAELWLQSWGEVEAARATARQVAELTRLPLVDRAG